MSFRSTEFVLVLTLTTIAVGQVGPDAAPDPRRPNIVLLMADDLGWGDVGFRGHPHIQTPSLDAMAAAGMRLDRFYAAAPVCSPTRGSCLTGRHPYRYGITFANTGHLPESEPCLADRLRAVGYRTGHFGKWHLGTMTTTERDSNRGGPEHAAHFAPPWRRGFDVCFSTEAKVPTFDPMRDPKSGKPYGTAYWNERGEKVTRDLDGDDSRVIMDRVVPFVRDCVDNERAFFAVVWFHTPHLPLVASAADREPFRALDEPRQHYFGAVRAMDREIGRLRAELRELGVERDTLLWFASDNGPEGTGRKAIGSSGGLRGRKRSLFEGGIRVPGIVEWPGRIASGSVCELPIVTSDFLPTIGEWVGLEAPEQPLDGLSVVPVLVPAPGSGTASIRSRGIGFESRNRIAWVTARHKLVGVLGPQRKREGAQRPVRDWLMYDLIADPAERVNLLAEEGAEQRAVAEPLQRACLAWRASRR